MCSPVCAHSVGLTHCKGLDVSPELLGAGKSTDLAWTWILGFWFNFFFRQKSGIRTCFYSHKRLHPPYCNQNQADLKLALLGFTYNSPGFTEGGCITTQRLGDLPGHLCWAHICMGWFCNVTHALSYNVAISVIHSIQASPISSAEMTSPGSGVTPEKDTTHGW